MAAEKTEYWKAEQEVVDMANGLIQEHHPYVSELNICYLFRSKHGKRAGKIVAGSCKKENGRAKLLHGFDFIVTIAADIFQEMTSEQREALLLHELLHIGCSENKEGEMEFRIQPHDFSGFKKVIELYGLWSEDLESLAVTIEARAAIEGAERKVVVEKGEGPEFEKGDDEDIFKEE